MRYLEPATAPQVKISLAGDLGKRVGRTLDYAHAKVALACGALPYLRQGLILDLYQRLLKDMGTVGYQWQSHPKHADLLETLEDVGGLENCPQALLRPLTKWLVLAYIGEPGYSYSGRPVFYSNTAAPITERLFQNAPKPIFNLLKELAKDRDVLAAIARSKPVARRFELILDMEPQVNTVDQSEQSQTTDN
jgi:hypothetical protein